MSSTWPPDHWPLKLISGRADRTFPTNLTFKIWLQWAVGLYFYLLLYTRPAYILLIFNLSSIMVNKQTRKQNIIAHNTTGPRQRNRQYSQNNHIGYCLPLTQHSHLGRQDLLFKCTDCLQLALALPVRNTRAASLNSKSSSLNWHKMEQIIIVSPKRVKNQRDHSFACYSPFWFRHPSAWLKMENSILGSIVLHRVHMDTKGDKWWGKRQGDCRHLWLVL